MELLIVFAKVPELGKVKSRIAKDVGPEKALSVYKFLLDKTFETAKATKKDVCVCLEGNDDKLKLNLPEYFFMSQQKGLGIGERMLNSIEEGLQKGYDKVVLVGADIYDLSSDIILNAFIDLTHSDIVLGPAYDGGYYLIGMKKLYPQLFQDIPWSTAFVLDKTIEKCKKQELTYTAVSRLNDIDTLDDLKKYEELKHLLLK